MFKATVRPESGIEAWFRVSDRRVMMPGPEGAASARNVHGHLKLLLWGGWSAWRLVGGGRKGREGERNSVQGYLAHKETLSPLGPP